MNKRIRIDKSFYSILSGIPPNHCPLFTLTLLTLPAGTHCYRAAQWPPYSCYGNQIAISSFSLAARAVSTFLMYLSNKSCKSFSAFFWSSSVISLFFFSFFT